MFRVLIPYSNGWLLHPQPSWPVGSLVVKRIKERHRNELAELKLFPKHEELVQIIERVQTANDSHSVDRRFVPKAGRSKS